jgi:hypothetical protein
VFSTFAAGISDSFDGTTGCGASTQPQAGLIFDAADNLYGASVIGGASGNGYVYQLAATSGGSWTFSNLYSFKGVADGWLPSGGVVVGGNGHLYGTTYYGGPVTRWGGAGTGLGTLYEPVPPAVSGGSWTAKIVHNFTGSCDGFLPASTPILGSGGVLFHNHWRRRRYLRRLRGQPACCGTVYQFVP